MTLSHVIWLRPRIHVEKFFILIVYQFEMALCTVINLRSEERRVGKECLE